MAEHELPKLRMRVRFPSSAPSGSGVGGGHLFGLVRALARSAPSWVTLLVVTGLVVLLGASILSGRRWAGEDAAIEQALDAKYAESIAYERITTGRWSRHRREFVFVDGQRRRDCRVRGGADDPVLACERDPQPTPVG